MERCIQQRTGECGGCPIQEMAKDRIYAAQTAVKAGDPDVNRQAIADRIAGVYCPEGTKIIVPSLSQSSVW